MRSAAWSGASRWIAQALSWAGTIVVARLLVPDDYGLIASVTVVLGAARILADFGIASAVVTLRQLTDDEIAQLNTIAIGLGVACAVSVAGLSVPLAGFFGRAELIPLTAALSTTFLLSGLRSVPAARLERELRFGTLAVVECVQAVLGVITAVSLAWFGWGVWALAMSILASQVGWTALVLAIRPCPTHRPRWRALSGSLAFSRHQLTGSLAWYWYSNADFVVAGRMLGARDLGVYSMAWTIARAIPERVSHLVIRQTPAFFSAVGHDRARLRTWTCGVVEGVSVISFPLLAGLWVVAPDVTGGLLGSGWRDAAGPARWLLLHGAIDVVVQPITRALVACGEARFTARMGLAMAMVMPLAFIAGAGWGPEGIAIAWLAAVPLRAAAILRAYHAIGLRPGELLAALRSAAVSSAVMLAVIGAASHALDGFPGPARIFLLAACGASVYVAALATFFPERVRYWRTLRPSVARA